MRIGRSLRASARALTVHRVRTLLALASVSVGVAAVVLTGAIGVGTARGIDRQIQSMGANLLVVRPADVKRLVGRKQVSGPATTLTPDDYTMIAELPEVACAAPGVDASQKVKAAGGRVTTNAIVVGTTPAFIDVRRFRVRSGRFFDAADDRNARRVTVLGAGVAAALFEGGTTAHAIRIRGVPFDVVGVLAAKGILADGDEDNRVLIPMRTALRRVYNVTWLTAIYVSVADPRSLGDVESRIERALAARHRPLSDGQPDFEVQDARRYFTLQRKASETLQALTLGLGAVALVVGGTGIMALMLMSVKERTAEIGLRVAVGARPRDIVNQFLMESTALALGGWIGGAAMAFLGGAALSFETKLELALPGAAMGGSLAMALVVGLGFGAWPARRASMVAPIRALAG